MKQLDKTWMSLVGLTNRLKQTNVLKGPLTSCLNYRFEDLALNVCVYDVSELLGDSVLDDKWWWVIEWLSQLRDNKSILTKLIMKYKNIWLAWDGLKLREDFRLVCSVLYYLVSIVQPVEVWCLFYHVSVWAGRKVMFYERFVVYV